MRCARRSHRPLVSFCVGIVCSVVTVGKAGDDEVLFRYAVALQNETQYSDSYGETRANYQEFQRNRCVRALARLRRERETLLIFGNWSTDDAFWQKSRLRDCWGNELYLAGLNLARRSKLPLSVRLTSLATQDRVPPDSLITQLLNHESEALSEGDQDMVALLRFATLYDNTCRRAGSEADLTKLIPAALAVAPRVLRLSDTSYPPGPESDHFHPVQYEIDDCSLAILSIVPADQRTDAIIELTKERQLGHGGMAASHCSSRGWIPAVESGCDLYSDDWAVFKWRAALLEHLSVDLRSSSERPSAKQKAQPTLHRLRSQVRALMGILRSRSYQGEPEHLTPFFEESDAELWSIHVLLSLEAARVHTDKTLLQAVAKELLSQSTRIHNPADRRPGPAWDLTRLYQSAHRAAGRVGDEKLQEELLERMIAIYPHAVGERAYEGILSDFDGEMPVWVRVVCDGSRDMAVVRRFEDVMVEMLKLGRPKSPEGATAARRSLGAFWAMTGASKTKADRILGTCRHLTHAHHVAYGVGLAVGY